MGAIVFGTVVADVVACLKSVVEVSLHDTLRRFRGRPDNYPYPILGEKVLRTTSHAARDDDSGSLLVQPAGQKSGLVDW